MTANAESKQQVLLPGWVKEFIGATLGISLQASMVYASFRYYGWRPCTVVLIAVIISIVTVAKTLGNSTPDAEE